MAKNRPAPIPAFFILMLFFLSGCASRHAVADRRQPPPMQGSSTVENTGKSTSTEGASPAAASPAPTPKRAKPGDLPAPVGYSQEGNASWYGEPFHGRRASNGEIYDMYKLTAAHRTLPFDTVVRVTNLSNGKTTTVRITDRGPFVNDRIIDLSFAAARQIDSVGAGVVPVRLEIVSGTIDPTSGYFTVQVGAFRDHGNAERLHERLNGSYSPIFIQQYDSPDGVYFRVRVGRVSGEDAARQFGEQLRSREGFTPFVVRLDEGPPTGGNP
jgi:rare lipoprotein A